MKKFLELYNRYHHYGWLIVLLFDFGIVLELTFLTVLNGISLARMLIILVFILMLPYCAWAFERERAKKWKHKWGFW